MTACEAPEACRADYYGGAVLALTAAELIPGTAGVNPTVVLYNALRDARRSYYAALWTSRLEGFKK